MYLRLPEVLQKASWELCSALQKIDPSMLLAFVTILLASVGIAFSGYVFYCLILSYAPYVCNFLFLCTNDISGS